MEKNKPIDVTPEMLEKIHQVGQELLDVFVQICEENHFRYYLYYGTLLGAVRHKGPIPWDDDVDVAMPREDMEKFRALMLARPEGELYQIDCYDNDPGLWVPFVRLRKMDTVFVPVHDLGRDIRFRGLWLDVFPLDDIPYTAGLRHKLYCQYVALQMRIVGHKAFVTTEGMRWTGKTFHMLLRPFPYERLYGWLEKSMRRWEGRGCKAYESWAGPYPYWKDTAPKDWFEPAVEVEYGGKRYRAPKEWDKLLTQIYGDYMIPPRQRNKWDTAIPPRSNCDQSGENALESRPELLEKLHRAGQEILDAFVQICEENHFRYYLYYGTLLGAVRHKGPIPWDDDVDVAMPREDLEKLRALMLARPEGERYYLVCYEVEPRPYIAFFRFNQRNSELKVKLGEEYHDLWVDIFPLDDIPDDAGIARDLRVRYIKFLKRLTYNKSITYGETESLKGRLMHTLLLPFSYDRLYRLTEGQIRRQGKEPGRYYASWGSPYPYEKEVLPKDWYEPAAEVEYGGKRYHAPKEWDKLLTQIYGDYMIPPPPGRTPCTRRCDRDGAAAKPAVESPAIPQELMGKIHRAGQDILDAVVQICEENHLRYYLAYGTLLGAVRHQGPIPWDDDVDILMPREDVDKLKRIMLARPEGELYHIHCYENDPHYPYFTPRMNMRGTVYSLENVSDVDMRYTELWVDIFPLDTIPWNSGWRYHLLGWRVTLLKRLANNKSKDRTNKLRTRGKIVHMLLRPIRFSWLRQQTERLMRKWNGRGGGYYVDWTCVYDYRKLTAPKAWFEPAAEVWYAEKTYLAPCGWDGLLTQLYGDYMTLPPEEKRVAHVPVDVKL